MSKRLKWSCDECTSDVLVDSVKIVHIANGEFLFSTDTFGYKCEFCGFSNVYKSRIAEIRERCFDAEFKEQIKQKHTKVSEKSMDFFLKMIEYMDGENYFCVDNEDKFLSADRICKIMNMSEAEVDYIVDELWRSRLMMLVKFNDSKRYVINAYKLGLVSYEDFKKLGFITSPFFKINNASRDNSRRRQARINTLPNTFTDIQKAKLMEKFNGKCAFTGKDVPIQIDHVIPVASGCGGTIVENMLPIWQRINSSKCDSNVFEWYEKNGERFEVVPELFEQAIGYIAELNGMTYEEYRDYVYACHNAELTQTN